MKTSKLILTLILALSSSAFAIDRFDFSGRYTYSDVPELLQTIEVRVIKLYRQIDFLELKHLKEQGFSCKHVDSKTSRCARILTQAPLPQSVEDKIKARFAGATIEFGKLEGEPQVLFEGEGLIEYLVNQPVRVMKDHYEHYRYFMSGDLHKLQTGSEIPSDHSFVIDHESRLSLIRTFAARLPNGFYRYIVALPFQK